VTATSIFDEATAAYAAPGDLAGEIDRIKYVLYIFFFNILMEPLEMESGFNVVVATTKVEI
jgi:hypothetical protein